MTEPQRQPPVGSPPAHPAKPGLGILKITALVLSTVVVSVALTVWLMTTYVFPNRFEPVKLSGAEEAVLEEKLQRFGLQTGSGETPMEVPSGDVVEGKLQPEPYTEVGAKREVAFSERELNALLAKNTDLADKLAIDLAEGLASARLLFPIDPDFPVLGGKTVKASAGLELAYADARPIVVLKGVSIWGVPVPNAWLGGLKDVDLVQEFGGREGFWKSFADGIENIRIQDGILVIKLKE